MMLLYNVVNGVWEANFGGRSYLREEEISAIKKTNGIYVASVLKWLIKKETRQALAFKEIFIHKHFTPSI